MSCPSIWVVKNPANPCNVVSIFFNFLFSKWRLKRPARSVPPSLASPSRRRAPPRRVRSPRPQRRPPKRRRSRPR